MEARERDWQLRCLFSCIERRQLTNRSATLHSTNQEASHGRRDARGAVHKPRQSRGQCLHSVARREADRLGYEVFADVLRLRGGNDWERILENAIRVKSTKVLLVATPHGVQKQGVRNEITIATETAKKIGDHQFIVPLCLRPSMPRCRSRTRSISIFRMAGRTA